METKPVGACGCCRSETAARATSNARPGASTCCLSPAPPPRGEACGWPADGQTTTAPQLPTARGSAREPWSSSRYQISQQDALQSNPGIASCDRLLLHEYVRRLLHEYLHRLLPEYVRRLLPEYVRQSYWPLLDLTSQAHVRRVQSTNLHYFKTQMSRVVTAVYAPPLVDAALCEPRAARHRHQQRVWIPRLSERVSLSTRCRATRLSNHDR